jgi:cell division control protein 45
LSQYFTLPKRCHLHIIDSHRPWNLSNLFGLDLDVADDDDDEEDGDSGGRFWVWGDGEEAGLGEVKKSWEALEVGFFRSPGILAV